MTLFCVQKKSNCTHMYLNPLILAPNLVSNVTFLFSYIIIKQQLPIQPLITKTLFLANITTNNCFFLGKVLQSKSARCFFTNPVNHYPKLPKINIYFQALQNLNKLFKMAKISVFKSYFKNLIQITRTCIQSR